MKDFIYYNPNPDASVFKSGKPKSWNRDDSVIRAICKVTNKSWSEVYKSLTEIGAKKHDMPDSKDVVLTYLTNANMKFITCGKPKTGEKRLTVEEFAKQYNKGLYIVYLRDYYLAIVDGIVYDTINNNDNMVVYSYWTLSK